MFVDQDFYNICFVFLILQLRLQPTAKGRSFLGPNIRLRPKVKIVPTVQHCKKETSSKYMPQSKEVQDSFIIFIVLGYITLLKLFDGVVF